jgi:hypothetical protein
MAYFETRIMIVNGGLVLTSSIFVLQAHNGMVDNEKDIEPNLMAMLFWNDFEIKLNEIFISHN